MSSHFLHPQYVVKKHQFVIRAEELDAAGTPCGAEVNGLSVRVTSASQTALPDLRIGAEWRDVPPFTELLPPPDSPAQALGPETAYTAGWGPDTWQTFYFSQPTPAWDGESDLLLEFTIHRRDGSESGPAPSVQMRTTGDPDRHAFGYSNSAFAYPFEELNTVGVDGEIPSLLLWF